MEMDWMRMDLDGYPSIYIHQISIYIHLIPGGYPLNGCWISTFQIYFLDVCIIPALNIHAVIPDPWQGVQTFSRATPTSQRRRRLSTMTTHPHSKHQHTLKRSYNSTEPRHFPPFCSGNPSQKLLAHGASVWVRVAPSGAAGCCCGN